MKFQIPNPILALVGDFASAFVFHCVIFMEMLKSGDFISCYMARDYMLAILSTIDNILMAPSNLSCSKSPTKTVLFSNTEKPFLP